MPRVQKAKILGFAPLEMSSAALQESPGPNSEDDGIIEAPA